VGGRILRLAMFAALIAGVVLGVLGLSEFSSASDDEKKAKEIAALRRELRSREREAQATERGIDVAIQKLDDQLAEFRSTYVEIIDADNAVREELNAATDLFNAGNLSGARQRYEAQAAAILKLQAKLQIEKEALQAARDALAELEGTAAE
jgi:hypothetical protein